MWSESRRRSEEPASSSSTRSLRSLLSTRSVSPVPFSNRDQTRGCWIEGRANPKLHLVQYNQEVLRKDLNKLQKEIGVIKKAKGDAGELLEKKADLDKQIKELATKADELLKVRDKKAGLIGNIVDKDCHVSLTEVRFIAPI